MIINFVTDYLPDMVISNDYFFDNYGITSDEIIAKSGIKQRRRTMPDENTNTMAIKAVKNVLNKLPYSLNKIDLIIGATYTPYDTVGTLAHAVQAYFKMERAKSFTIDSACSSFLNALEIADCFLKVRKSKQSINCCF